jgi:hypothetical protein
VDEMDKSCNTHGEKRNAYTYMVLLGKPEGKRPLEISRRMLEDSVKMNVREIVQSSMDRIHLAQDKRPVAGFCE